VDFVKLKTAGVTTNLNVSYNKPVHISKGAVTVRGHLVSTEKRKAMLECTLFDGNNEPCATADVTYFIFPEKIARAKYNYPGAEAFIDGD
jgi:acyl-coenzyme A thioesterase PaaI-like protein